MISAGSNGQKKHKKHASLTRPAIGSFSRNEWAILGAPCSTIKLLADTVIQALSKDYHCSYVDTAHDDELTAAPARIAAGAVSDYTDHIQYRQVNYRSDFNIFQQRALFGQADMVLVNGNHQQAKAQVVIINEHKKASLQKRLAQLTDVQLILLDGSSTALFEFVKEALPHWNQLPVYHLDETEKIIRFFRESLSAAKPKLNGLVLTGGKSERMGFNKAMVNWHGSEQQYYIADLLGEFCDEVFISCRSEQLDGIKVPYQPLPDTFAGLGPYGGILSAFRERPDNAWLVVACDLPLLGHETLRFLTDNRRTQAIATAFQSSFDEFPEPLITIWEPKSYPVLLSFLSQGYSCPRKVLINSVINLLQPPLPEELTNVNTPDDYEKVKQTLRHKTTAG